MLWFVVLSNDCHILQLLFIIIIIIIIIIIMFILYNITLFTVH